MALQYWCFTWNASNEDTLPEVDGLRRYLDERDWRYVFQTEMVSRRHYQGRIDLKDKSARMVKATLLSVFEAGGYDITNLTVTPESNASVKTSGSLFYATKTESRVDGPWHDASFVAPQRPIVYNGEDLACMENLLPWQQEIMDIVNDDPDDRRIVWIYNEVGNAGKSKLQKWLAFRHGARRVPLGTATQIKTAVADGTAKSLYMVNLPRVTGSQESQRDLFSALEEIKDGWVESCMYGKEHQLFMKPPHLLIFSNDVPDLKLASADRWVVYDLEHAQSQLREMGPREITALRKRKLAEALFPEDDDDDALADVI